MTAIPAIRLCLGSLGLALAMLALGAPVASAAKCTKKGTNGADVLRGTKKGDVICGRGGADVLIGRAGKDQLIGGPGADTLRGGAGADKLKGSGGTDAASFEDAPSAVTVNLANHAASGNGEDTLSGVEGVSGSPFADILTGDDGDNVLSGGEGDDRLAGAAGADTLGGDGGSDTANYFAATAPISADLLAGTASGQGADSLPAIENVTGSPQDDTLAGDPGANTLHGGTGNDTVSFAGATSGVSVDLAADTATGSGDDSVPAIENVTGSPFDDTLGGDSGPNVLAGAAGTDTVSYASSAAGVTVNLLDGSATGDGDDELSSIEGAIGSSQADNLQGDDSANSIAGGDGPDVLDTGPGSDQLAGDGGNDQIFGGPQNDVLTGADGDDLLDGGPGVDDCDGGIGSNTFAGGCDTQPPQLDGVSISPASIDTEASARDVTVTLDLSDAMAGVNAAGSEVAIAAPDGTPRGVAPLQLVTGDTHDGTFEATFSIPRYAPTGTWTVSLRLVDSAGNEIAWSSSQLIAASHPGSFEQTGAGDAVAPSLTDFAIAPASIDTAGSSQVVTFTLDATDAVAGIDPAASSVSIASPDGEPRDSDALELISGTSTNGTFQAAITVPRYAPQGTWTVSLSLVDGAGNALTRTSAQLITDGYPGTFEQTGSGDGAAPVLTSFSLSPAQVNTLESSDDVTFTLHLTDGIAGVDAAASKVVVTSPDSQSLDSNGLQLVSGTPSDGTYQATITVPQGSTPGTWTVSLVLRDAAANEVQWSSGELDTAGYPSSFTNIGSDPI